MKKLNLNEVKEFIINTSLTTKIYIGSDSARYRKKDDVWYAEYCTVVVVHYNGNRGCKVFGNLESERDYDQKMDKPRMRLMNEVIRTAQMYLDLEEAIGQRHVQIHLDINPDEKHGSSCVISEAVGYIKGMCNVVPFVKPNAFAASIAADRLLG
jgi:predicted RNase H-related nuclease YkuK (DUF458 family)